MTALQFQATGRQKKTTKSTHDCHGKNAEEMPSTQATGSAGNGLNGAQGSQIGKGIFNWNTFGWLPRLTSIKLKRLAIRNSCCPKRFVGGKR